MVWVKISILFRLGDLHCHAMTIINVVKIMDSLPVGLKGEANSDLPC